ncbi:DUF155-domain-containing protein [Piedraia hortae CBS 480.64]|uniref:DUF155-domain-containing protein n=1 Tax=Piedraia hortae CBS 480.64 TaxID=1314780 RepID=A0A6A7BSG9_9PEZI|nr:DUF155-domain-containing protein [Piedraia hortae CBS 480.64]
MSANSTVPNRGPSVLVTDARESWQKKAAAPNPANTSRLTVDSVLQYATDIPSAQRRGAPTMRPQLRARQPSGPVRGPTSRPASGPAATTGAANLPARTSKTSEKLVLLPETAEETESDGDDSDADEERGPPTDETLNRRRQASANRRGKSTAERLPKSLRIADAHLARVTAYCTSQSHWLEATARFVKEQHGARTKLYDDCLYCVYQLPLLGGNDGYRVRSSPAVRSAGGRSVLDEQIEANERREYREGWHEESDEYSVPNESGGESKESDTRREDLVREWKSRQTHQPAARDGRMVAEMFVFKYGVVVLWHFSLNQEKDILADLTFSTIAHVQPGARSRALATQRSLMRHPLEEDEFETEEFHFEYDASCEKPRIFNDMITLRTSDHMIKLAMSHAIAQSTKLNYFEERMQRTMAEAQWVPKHLALQGKLGMSRKEVVALVGRLFEGRVDVNLSSNMLDTPTFLWDSEPMLHPLYAAVREYLEIKPRIQVLNERCRVFLDLAEMLSDSIADTKMTRITWIIIFLIVLSILVTVGESVLRFGMLASGKAANGSRDQF